MNMILTLQKLKRFTKKDCKKKQQQEFRVKKVIKTKRNKRNIKWKGRINSFNSWIDKKDKA